MNMNVSVEEVLDKDKERLKDLAILHDGSSISNAQRTICEIIDKEKEKEILDCLEESKTYDPLVNSSDTLVIIQAPEWVTDNRYKDYKYYVWKSLLQKYLDLYGEKLLVLFEKDLMNILSKKTIETSKLLKMIKEAYMNKAIDLDSIIGKYMQDWYDDNLRYKLQNVLESDKTDYLSLYVYFSPQYEEVMEKVSKYGLSNAEIRKRIKYAKNPMERRQYEQLLHDNDPGYTGRHKATKKKKRSKRR